MGKKSNSQNTQAIIKQNNDTFNQKNNSFFIVMAAGHGKRIKSTTPKVLHRLWGEINLVRVINEISKGLKTDNQAIVIGKKADIVVNTLQKKKNRLYCYQREQLGTGHAVQTAVDSLNNSYKAKNIFIFPGDVGLITSEEIKNFKNYFQKNSCDMMMLTGQYSGDIRNNYYGRIVRVTDKADKNYGQVLAIVQQKDILCMKIKEQKTFSYANINYAFSKEELLKIREFDSGIFAFQYPLLKKYIKKIEKKNAQNEFYLTDLVAIFNHHQLKISTYSITNSDLILGFNDKSTLHKMENIIRLDRYQKVKNCIVIENKERFFIHDEVIKNLLISDKKGNILDLFVGTDSFIGRNVKIGKNVYIGQNIILNGNIVLEDNVRLESNITISNYEKQKIIIGNGTTLLGNTTLKGNVKIGKKCFFENHLQLTGSDQHPLKIGIGVHIKGNTYLYGCVIEDYCFIEYCTLIQKKINCVRGKKGEVRPIKFVFPLPQGKDFIENL